MFEGSDEVEDFRKSLISDVKFIPQRGTMFGGADEAIRVIASPQRGIKPGGAIGGPNDIDDPSLEWSTATRDSSTTSRDSH